MEPGQSCAASTIATKCHLAFVLQYVLMERDVVLNVRLPSKTKKALRMAAIDDERTMSSMVAKVLKDWLTTQGYLGSVESLSKKRTRK